MARSERSALPHGPTAGVTSPPLPASGTSFIKKLQKPAGICVSEFSTREGRAVEAKRLPRALGTFALALLWPPGLLHRRRATCRTLCQWLTCPTYDEKNSHLLSHLPST